MKKLLCILFCLLFVSVINYARYKFRFEILEFEIKLIQFFVSCTDNDRNYLAYDIELWENIENWDFAKAVSKNNFKRAEELLERNHYDIDCREPKFGKTLLSWAVWNDNPDAVKFLLEHGANPNVHDKCSGISPITEAAGLFVSIEILEYLLQYGGNPNDYVKEDEILTHGRCDKTPLTTAYLSLEKTKLLIEAGADIDFTADPGYTALFWAASSTSWAVLEYLLNNCDFDYNKTYVITIHNDTLYLKDLILDNNVAARHDTIRAKRILNYVDKHFK